MKKKFLVFLAFSLILSQALFANGQNEKQTADEDLYEILWYNIGTPQKDTEKVFEELSKYTAEKIGATVKMVQFDWGEYSDRMKVITASGEPYDIAFTCSWANNYDVNVERGAFLPLDDLLKTHGQGTLDVINPSFFKGITINNSVYAIPANKELGWWEVWLFNEEYVNKYNFDISEVKSIQDLAPMLEIVKAGESADFTPIMGDSQFGIDTPEYAYVIGPGTPFVVDFDNTDYKVKNIYETPEMMDNLITIHDYYTKGYMRKDIATLNNTEELRKSKKWFVTKSHWQPYAENLIGKSWDTPLVYSSSYIPYADNSSTQGSMQAISVTSGNPEKSMAFLNLMNTDPYVRNLVGFGIEGTHWEKKGENVIATLEDSKAYQVPGFTLQNLLITHLFEDDPADKWEKFQEFNDSCRPSPVLGFQFDRTSVKTELAVLANIFEEFKPFMQTGTVDPEEYVAKYLKRVDEAGGAKVQAEIQNQLNAWLATQK